MRVVIAGGHGKIALLLERLLSSRGDSVAGLIRNPEQIADLEGCGRRSVGRGPGELLRRAGRRASARCGRRGVRRRGRAGKRRGPERNRRPRRCDSACGGRRGRRGQPISDDFRRGADDRTQDSAADPVFAAYLRAKAAADTAIRRHTALNLTIVRPGLLTNDPGTGRVTIADSTGRGSIPREDVAAVLVALLDRPETGGQTFEVISGDTPIADAVAARAG